MLWLRTRFETYLHVSAIQLIIQYSNCQDFEYHQKITSISHPAASLLDQKAVSSSEIVGHCYNSLLAAFNHGRATVVPR